jgi:hypothetical protein
VHGAAAHSIAPELLEVEDAEEPDDVDALPVEPVEPDDVDALPAEPVDVDALDDVDAPPPPEIAFASPSPAMIWQLASARGVRNASARSARARIVRSHRIRAYHGVTDDPIKNPASERRGDGEPPADKQLTKQTQLASLPHAM